MLDIEVEADNSKAKWKWSNSDEEKSNNEQKSLAEQFINVEISKAPHSLLYHPFYQNS